MIRRRPRSTPFPYTTLFRSGRNQPVNTAAMGVCPACPPTCLFVLSANNGSRTADRALCMWEGGYTADVQQDFQIAVPGDQLARSEEHTSELQSQSNLVCRLL